MSSLEVVAKPGASLSVVEPEALTTRNSCTREEPRPPPQDQSNPARQIRTPGRQIRPSRPWSQRGRARRRRRIRWRMAMGDPGKGTLDPPPASLDL
jgi:hypothetical protein